MAGDWIKIEMTTPDKPEVVCIAAELGIDADAAFGKLFRVWSWFDQHSTNGHAPSVTRSALNRVSGVPNFCDAMENVGWLIDDGESIRLPNFDRHNGESAKKRALAADRKRKSRTKSDTVTSESRSDRDISVPESVTREEKRRSKTTTTNGGDDPPVDNFGNMVEFDDRDRFKIFDGWKPDSSTFPAICFRAGAKPEYSPDQLGDFINWHIDEARNTFRSQHDWERLFCKWLKGDQSNGKGDEGNGNGPKGGGSGGSRGLSVAERIERANP